MPSAKTIARLMANGRYTLSKSETVTIVAIEQGVPLLVEARAGFLSVFFGIGIFPILKLYIAEQYPTELRGEGAGIGEAVSRLLGGVVATYYAS
ncbi:hypothetical protein [Bradyrhizobium sp. Ash2021]|uniref:hypothetical protein n=1 Tax=Bradyrhizobium sp. Ash2021 TaxID=2954771 RepID=UPI00281611CB|nr:hypothetical protein [Bradyrhizobium sp. Ash2021]WMT72083.1 hypothetical protein NL528_29005 [Bradyrhizobium sp. Ash2021]